MNKLLLCCLVLIISVACNRNPYAATNKVYKKQAKDLAATLMKQPLQVVANDSVKVPEYWAGTVNFNMRKPNFVILHHTAQDSCGQTLRTFTLTRTQVSAHYVICKDGTISQMLNDYLRAWHGGVSRWGNVTDINSVSIGIEIDNNGFDPFTTEQINSLLSLLGTLKASYNIPAANFIGHADIAPTRKNDPSVLFPWKTLADKGFGVWWDDTTNVAVPIEFSHMQALRIVGYDVRDSSATFKAFKRHFIPLDTAMGLTEDNRKVLYGLYRKYM